MNRSVNTVIDRDSCTGCGLCVGVCPSDTLSLDNDGIAVVTGEWSLGCGHCAAVCPEQAITVTSIDPEAWHLEGSALPGEALKPGQADLEALTCLMASRRSCRSYLDRPVDGAMLRDLVRIGTLAPTGTNSQAWTFTILPDRKALDALGRRVSAFFHKLNRMAEKPHLRLLSRLFMKDVLGQYYREYYQTVKEGLRQWEEEGRDRLFHGAAACILVGSTPEATCPSEDALLATQNILLAAHAMGLGSCLIGFVVEAMKNDPSIGPALGLVKGERIHAVIALGWPRWSYRRVTGRRSLSPRVVTAEELS